MSFKHINKGLEDLLAQLEEEASSIADAHTEWLLEQGRNRKDSWDDRSKLTINWKRAGDSIVIYWHQVKWVGTAANKTRRTVLAWIKKPKESHSYNLPKLLSYAQEWESDMVRETERKAAKVRRKLKAYQRLAFAFRVAQQEFEVADGE